MQQLECVLQDRICLTSDTSLYRFEVLGQPMTFVPGQFVSLSIPDPSTGTHVIRAYSVAGANDARATNSPTRSLITNRFELIIRHVTDGRGTTILQSLPLGSKLTSSQPTGRLTVDLATTHEGPLVFIANTTGIAPFRAMMQYFKLTHTYANVTILWGLKTVRDVYMFKELVQYEEEWKNHGGRFRILFCLSQETSISDDADLGATHIRLGRVQASYNLLTDKNYQFFICGSKAFVIDVKQSLGTSFPGSIICLERFN